MRTINLLECTAVLAVLTANAWGQEAKLANLNEPLFRGRQNNQPEIHFDSATGMVTVKAVLQDHNGYFIPNIRRENFAVYEDGVRQSNATVEIEHAPVSLGVLMEWGGRYSALNKTLAEEVPRAAQQLLDELGRQDKIAIWKYGDRADQFADFSKDPGTLFLTGVRPPELSETNFYDALLATLQQMQPVSGRKAMVLISTGVDTFSQANYDDLLNAVRREGVPIYVIDIAPVLRRAAQGAPYISMDWNRAETEIRKIAEASGGRMYSIDSTSDLTGVYDNLMQNLKVRYVISYKSSSANSDINNARTVRIELIDPQTGGPLQLVDAGGKPIPSKLTIEDSYTPLPALVAGQSPSPSADRNKEK